MTMQFDAYNAWLNFKADYLDFVSQELGTSEIVDHEKLRQVWTAPDSGLFAPLHVQAAFPFKPAKTIHEIPTLHPRAVELFERAGISYKLFEHQVQAIEAARDGKTVVVSAGTGSGKTEAFLFPIINDLFHAHDEGRDDLSQPGVRALIVYPLNALVNNQIQRLAELIGEDSPLKFAFYTGRLKEKERDARRYYNDRGMTFPRSQIIDRETLRDSPPHILVTNFSMLQYMLVRPTDQPLFMPEKIAYNGQPRLRSIVLDEAHVYGGAQADEIHLLLRRAAQRFGTTLSKVQGFATSATLSTDGGEDVLLNYAAGIFDSDRDDVAPILGKSYLPELEARPAKSELKVVDRAVPDIRTLDFDESGRSNALASSTEHVKLLSELGLELGLIDSLDEMPETDFPAHAAHFLCRHPRILELRDWLYTEGQLKTHEELAEYLYGRSEPDALRSAYLILHLGSLARNVPHEHPIIPARLHAFMRAPAGVWLGLGLHEGELLTTAPEDPEAPWAEITRCASCNAHYLRAFEAKDDWGDSVYKNASDLSEVRVFKLSEHGQEIPKWGAKVRFIGDHCEECDEELELRPLNLGYEQSLGPIVDAVYPELAAYPAEDPTKLPGHGRRLMTFSDSRRDAARVAASLERTHDRGLSREILWYALHSEGEAVKGSDLEDNVANMTLTLAQMSILQAMPVDSDSAQDAAKVVFFGEFGRPTAALSMESLGIVRVDYPGIPPKPRHLTELDESEWRTLVACLMDELRTLGVVKTANFGRFRDLDINLYLDKSVSRNGQGATRSWIPVQAKRRSPIWGFAQRVASTMGVDAEKLMLDVWDVLAEQKPRWWFSLPEGGYKIDLQKLNFSAVRPSFRDQRGRAIHRQIRGIAPRTREVVALSPEEQDAWMQEHRTRRVTNGKFLGLWTFEHTAQISPDELETRELEFRTGRLNLLASSTTLEMGVDLGGLTFVLLTNVPPGPSNYWQRAGRAGRRADGSSLVLSLARPRPHDQKAFADPRAFLTGKIIPPGIRGDGEPLVARHIKSLLLSEFFKTRPAEGQGGNPLHAFGIMREFSDPQIGAFEDFLSWLEQLDPRTAAMVTELKAGTCLEDFPNESLCQDTRTAIYEIISAYRKDEARLVSEIAAEEAKARGQQDGLFLGALRHQLKNLHGEHLIPYLSRYEFLPRFGFPIDVVRLETKCRDDEGSSPEEELRMERSLSLALAEYVPGFDVLARKRVYRVQGLIKNWDDPMAKHKYLLTCNRCNAQRTSDAQPTECPVCAAPAPLSKVDKEGASVQMFLEPGGMAVAMDSSSKRYAGPRSMKRAKYPERALVLKTQPQWQEVEGVATVQVGWLTDSRMLTRTSNPLGFAICPSCGFAEPESAWDGALPDAMRGGHTRLRGANRCGGVQPWRNRQLGTHVNVDTFLMRFPGRLGWQENNMAAVTTFAACAQQVVAELLQVDSRTLSSLVYVSAQDELWAAIVEESGAGFLGSVAESPGRLISELRTYFESTDALSFVRFENQFLASTELFRLDLAAQILG